MNETLESLEKLRAPMKDWMNEALQSRFDSSHKFPENSSLQEVLDSLIRVRGRLDRVEAILTRVIRTKAKIEELSQALRAEADLAWDEALISAKSKPRRGFNDDFVPPRERYADAKLVTLEVQRAARRGEEIKDDALSVFDVVRICHRGLNGLREDHLAILRAWNVGSRLET